MKALLLILLLIPGLLSAQTGTFTLEAETMSIKPANGALPDGFWALWSTSSLEHDVAVPSGGACKADIFAYGTPGGGLYPDMEVKWDVTLVGKTSVTVDPRNAKAYPFSFPCSMGTHHLSVAFTNGGNVDRHLFIDKIIFTWPAPEVLPTPAPIPAPTPNPVPPPSNSLQGLFVITNIAPGTIDTQPPVISSVTYGASTPADGATLSSSATRFEFRVSATDNFAVAYATLEVLTNITDMDWQLIQFKRAYLGPLTPAFVLTWDERINAGTYYLRIRVYDTTHNKAERVFTVKK